MDVYLGGDDSRHANELEYTIEQFVARGRYQLGSHTITGDTTSISADFIRSRQGVWLKKNWFDATFNAAIGGPIPRCYWTTSPVRQRLRFY